MRNQPDQSTIVPVPVKTETPQELDIVGVIRRLTLIQNLIQLGDLEDVDAQLAKLIPAELVPALGSILEDLKARRYGNALPSIELFIQQHRQVVANQDPALEGLRVEARALESKLGVLTDEHIDLERIIHQFQVRHAQELGPLMLKILHLRKEQATTSEERAEAEADRAAYEEDHEGLKDQVVYAITAEEQSDLKQMYRQASKLCHPDAVPPEHHKEAAEWFNSLREAYEQNDLDRVRQILDKLEKGIAFGSRTETFAEVERLRAWVDELRRKVEALLQNVMSIKQSETYRTIVAIVSWDVYFQEQKDQLSDQLNLIKNGREAN